MNPPEARTMKGIPWIVGLIWIAAARGAWAQSDTVRFRNPGENDLSCDVLSISWKEVKFNILAGDTWVAQSRPTRDVKEVLLSNEHKGFEFVSAEQSMSQNQFAEAVIRFEKTRRDPRTIEPVRQMARMRIAHCHFRDGQPDKAIAALADFRKEAPDTYFLADTYVLQYEAYRAKSPPDVVRMEQTLQEFTRDADSKGMSEWKGTAEVLRGDLFELQEKWDQALTIHAKYVEDPAVGTDAKLGKMRCLAAKQAWGQLRDQADSILSEAKARKGSDPRLLMGAYNAQGDVSLSQRKIKDAILDYMRGVLLLNTSGDPSREHEASIAKASMACSRYAGEAKDTNERSTYKQRARELLAELDRSYPASLWRKSVDEAVRAVK